MKNKKTNYTKYLLVLLILLTSLIASVTTKNVLINIKEETYENLIAVSTVPPKITFVETGENDIVELTVVKGTLDFKEFIIVDLDSGEYYSVPIKNESTTQYLSLKNGSYQLSIRDTSYNYETYNSFIRITNSCDNDEPKYDHVGAGTSERCYIFTGTNNINVDFNEPVVECREGYVIYEEDIKEEDFCSNLKSTDLVNYSLDYRFCKKTISYECVKATSDNSTNLKSLSISSGTLSPAFAPNTLNYTATVDANSLKVSATLNSDGSEFVSGFGPRTVDLDYGVNKILIKVESSSGNVTTYTLNVTRPDERSSVNTLNTLSITDIKLNETFSKDKTTYSANVDSDVESVYINAIKTDSNSTFVHDFGPREVTLKDGVNSIKIKVMSEKNYIKTYTINITKGEEVSTDNDPFLKSLIIENEGIHLSEEFDKNIDTYNITVENEITTLLIKAVAEHSNHTVVIDGNENFIEDQNNLIGITVTNPDTKENKVYTINVIRVAKGVEVSSDSYLNALEIEGYDINFKKDEAKYEIKLNEGENTLNIKATASSKDSTISIIGNEDLKPGSEVIVRVTAQDNTFTDYTITIDGESSGMNIFLVILLIIVVLIALIYLVLRILGYKIYFNFSMLTSMIKNIGNKDQN